MKTVWIAGFAMAAAMPAAFAQSTIYKHVDDSGRVTYSNKPMKGAAVMELEPLTTIPGSPSGRLQKAVSVAQPAEATETRSEAKPEAAQESKPGVGKPTPVSRQKSFTVQYGRVEGVDEVLTLLMRAPKSYTCEDMVEISAHGGPRILDRILALAFAVNLVELLCSAGIPAVYTQVLALSNLPTWQYYAYLALYIIVFMLDDLFVFVVAMKTLQITGIGTGYSRFSHLAGGVVLLAIGALLLLRPEWLMFG